MTEFWDLPAPARFLGAIAEDIRAGQNVALALPEHTPDGWLPGLRTSLRSLDLQRLETLEGNGLAPLSCLAQHLGIGPQPGRFRVAGLCERHEFHGRLLYVRLDDPVGWPAWRDFLVEYEDTCRRLDLSQRTLFVASLHGEVAADTPTPRNLLRVHSWPGYVDSLNMRLYAASLLVGEPLPAWQRHLFVAILAELALWDPVVCDAGAGRGLPGVLDPTLWLSELARDRGWSATDDTRAPTAAWQGLRQEFEGRSRLHSAWLALAGRNDTLSQRIWAGQVTALFPLLERQRRALLKSHRGLLRIPWPTTFGEIQDVADLELNHIAEQLELQRSGGLRALCEFVRWLRDMRNDLAHLEPVPALRLLDVRFRDRLTRALAEEDD